MDLSRTSGRYIWRRLRAKLEEWGTWPAEDTSFNFGDGVTERTMSNHGPACASDHPVSVNRFGHRRCQASGHVGRESPDNNTVRDWGQTGTRGAGFLDLSDESPDNYICSFFKNNYEVFCISHNPHCF